MMINSLPDLLSFQRQTRLTADLKSRLDITSREAVSGRRADITTHVRGDIGGVFLLEKALDDIDTDNRINALTAARVDLMGSSLSALRGVVAGLDVTGLAALSNPDSFGIGTISDQAQANLSSVFSLLSTAHGNRKLFAGDATDQTPLAAPQALLDDVRAIMVTSGDPLTIKGALDTYFNDPQGGFAQNIYQGGAGRAPASYLADGSRIEFSVKADDPALRDTLRGLAVMAVARDSGYAIDSAEFAEVFKGGTAALAKGLGGVIKLEGSLGIYAGLIENSKTQQAAEGQVLAQSLNDLTGRDQFEAAAELKQLESQLEASYLITARLANLSLTNFIR